jgi:hypothetical protein
MNKLYTFFFTLIGWTSARGNPLRGSDKIIAIVGFIAVMIIILITTLYKKKK